MHKPELLAHTDSASGDSTTRKLGSGYYIVHDLEPVSAHPPHLTSSSAKGTRSVGLRGPRPRRVGR